MQISVLLQSVLQSVRDKGLRHTVRRIVAAPGEWFLARRKIVSTSSFPANGIDTDGVVPLWTLDIDSPNLVHGVRYQAADADAVRADLDALPIRHDEFSFVDLGAGKGRVLAIACDYGFTEVIGVEFSRELSAVANANLQKLSDEYRVGYAAGCIHGDAADYQFENRDTVVFLYNPFGEVVMRKVLDNLAATFADAEHRLFIVYHNPVLAGLFDDSPYLVRTALPSKGVVYANRAAAPQPPA